MIRAATPDDAAAICAIWNPLIRDTGVTFNPVEKTHEDIRHLLTQKAALNEPFFVAETADGVVGIATYQQFRGGLGYQFTAEHSIVLAKAARGQGVGRAMMAEIEAHAAGRGVHSMFAGVSGENPAGVAFHARLGYLEIARLPEVGFKFDRWFDLILMQKMLQKPR